MELIATLLKNAVLTRPISAKASARDGDLLGDPANESPVGVVKSPPRYVRGLARNGQGRQPLTWFHHEAILPQCAAESADALAVPVDGRRMQVVIGIRADTR
jgi:hypothetical protein